MKTINTILPIYDSLEKQDKNRTGTQMPILTPRHRLPAFQWKDDTDGAISVSNIELIDKKGNSKGVDLGVTYWDYYPTHEKWTTFLSTGLDITYAHTTQAFTTASMLPSIKVIEGDVITLNYNLINYAGTQSIAFDIAGGESFLLYPGKHTITHIIAADILYPTNLYIRLNAGTLPCTFSLMDVSVEIVPFKDFFQSLPTTHTVGSDVYFQYKGIPLNYLLPLGEYYLKITMDNECVYYSDMFVVTDIYNNLIHSLSITSGYVSYTTIYKTTILSACCNTVSTNIIDSDSFNVKKGESITCLLYLTTIVPFPGFVPEEYPSIVLEGSVGHNSNVVILASGLNVITLTSLTTESVCLRIFNNDKSAWKTSEILAIRNYSPDFAIITFTDTHDLGDILYHDGFINTCFLEAKLNNPTHEVTEVGEEKNGIFITEKIVTKYKYKIIANVSRQLYTILMRLPQHDTITITDEVGNVYTPKVGNIWVSAPNWIFYDVCRLEIQFNDNSEFVWTSENNNLT